MLLKRLVRIITRQRRLFKVNQWYIVRWAKVISFPGSPGVSLYDVLKFFIKGIYNGAITTRASAVAFNFFMAVIPTLIFLFTLIPYIPIKDFQVQLLSLIKGIMPEYAFQTFETTLVEVITLKSGGLLSFGFLAAIFFSHNGISSLIDAFNATYHTIETRSFIAQHLIAFSLTFLLPLIVLLGVIGMFFGEMALNWLFEAGLIKMSFTFYLLNFTNWIIVISLFFFSISLLYYMAPAKHQKFKFFSAGSSLATLLIVLTSMAFSFYVNHFGQYNSFYGSLGGLIVLLLWIYFNAFGLILGFDLNASISSAKNTSQSRNN